ncbi:GNAT family N-acetyltransferase [Solirubrobacter phytolaccae]|uniref:GNAT family N-acetyltransferase n=1 Tax=Solirubrobacter phytolaccae TaxID=1404360 RepID=A0A9X3SA54_9ACTN|nr:GNAT family N-acetyltransferase [Solirubrobacter phytolaccae]MDA0184144.1 GNAT family N-acetyltransferase [Solirubrobacter phytolaccae]
MRLTAVWTIHSEPLDSPDSEALLWAYWHDIVARYYRHYEDRSIAPHEVDAAMDEYRTEDLAAWLVARWDGEPAGCAGLRRHGALTRMFIAPAYRRRGGARLLLRGVEDAARELGITKLQIDTRDDLVEAQRLYLAEGYDEVEPFNADEYAERFFEKRL